jgi:hypothetical protein
MMQFQRDKVQGKGAREMVFLSEDQSLVSPRNGHVQSNKEEGKERKKNKKKSST